MRHKNTRDYGKNHPRFRRGGPVPENVLNELKSDPFDPDYQKGIIREIDPPDWMDPEMEFSPTERGYKGFTPEGEGIPAAPARKLEDPPEEQEA